MGIFKSLGSIEKLWFGLRILWSGLDKSIKVVIYYFVNSGVVTLEVAELRCDV